MVRPLAAVGRLAKSAAADALFRCGLTRPERNGRDRLHVVTFHRVLTPEELRDYPLPEIAVTVADFAAFLRFFASHYTCGTLAEVSRRWLSGDQPERPLLAITFDDGQLDNYRHAFPALRSAGLKATFFVVADAVGGDAPLWHDRMAFAVAQSLRQDADLAARLLEPLGLLDAPDAHGVLLQAMERAKDLPPESRAALLDRLQTACGSPKPPWDGLMSWDHLRELVRSGHEVGSHSASHPILTAIDDASLEREVAGSRQVLESQLDLACESFCYPNGTCDRRVVDAARRAGYLQAVTTRWGSNDRPCDLLALARRDMQGPRVHDGRGRFSDARAAFRMSTHFPEPRP